MRETLYNDQEKYMKKLEYTKKYGFICTLLSLILIAIVAYAAFGKQSITFSENEVQTLLEKKLPVEIEGKELGQIYKITINEFPFDFQKDGEISTTISPTIETSLGSIHADIHITGQPDLIGRSFYFKPSEFKVDSFEFGSEAQAKISIASKIAGNFAKKYGGDLLKGTGVTVNKEVTKNKLTSFLQTEISSLVIRTLQDQPIYTLAGASSFISLGIDKIKITDNDVTIHFSILKFTGTILLLLAVFVAFIGLMFTAPSWIGALAIFSAGID